MYVYTYFNIYSACCMWHKNQLKGNNKNLDGVNDSKLGEWVKDKEDNSIENNWITVMKYKNKQICIKIYLQTYIEPRGMGTIFVLFIQYYLHAMNSWWVFAVSFSQLSTLTFITIVISFLNICGYLHNVI